MAESYKFDNKGVAGALEVFPELRWKHTRADNTYVFDDKQNKFVPVEQGQFIVKVGRRFEVSDTEPEKAKDAEPPKSAARQAKVEEAKAALEGLEPDESEKSD